MSDSNKQNPTARGGSINRIQNNKAKTKAKWQESCNRMYALAEQCLFFLKQFRRFSVRWQPWDNNVVRFGH